MWDVPEKDGLRIRIIRYLPVFLFCVAGSGALAQEWKDYPYVPEGSLISFPADEGWHPEEAIEWWYLAGHLTGAGTGFSYSFMLSYFYYPASIQGFDFDGFRILNLANDDTGEFFSETQPVLTYRELDTAYLHLDALLFNQVTESWDHRETPAGTRVPFEYTISASSEYGQINLNTVLQKRPLIPGGDGFFNQGASSYTYYYSLTDNLVSGTIDFNGSREQVEGTAWIDRQYGSFNPYSQEKYEWFFLQLSNGMDLNIWNLFNPENLLPDGAAYKHLSVYVDENTQYTEHDFRLERLAFSCLPGSGNCYARQWRLTSEINQLDLLITTLHPDAEVSLPFPFFEGTVEVIGTVNGRAVNGKGFAELLKHYAPPRLSLLSPGKLWNKSEPLTWAVLDPDQGRPLLFDLDYSMDDGNTWLPVAGALNETSYSWEDPPLMPGDSCLFRVSAYTADRVLGGVVVSPSHSEYADQSTPVEQEPSGGFRVYPNPVDQTLGILWEPLPRAAGRVSYRVTDAWGRVLMAGILSDSSIDVSELAGGVYLIKLDAPGASAALTFVKQ